MTRSRLVVIIVVVAALVAGAALGWRALSEPPATAETRDGSSASSTESPAGVAVTPADASPTAAAPRAATDEVVPPARTAARGTSGSRSSADEQERYRRETRRVVEDNAPDLAAAARRIAEALSAGDASALASAMTPGEADAAGYAATLAAQYPSFDDYRILPTVNVFSAGSTTVYIAYASVAWEDGGIASRHTIPLVFRFVGGQWRLSSLADIGADLFFVQSVDV